MKKQNVMMAAIAIAMQFPMSANDVLEISKAHNADHREVMKEVAEMLSAEYAATIDMANTPA